MTGRFRTVLPQQFDHGLGASLLEACGLNVSPLEGTQQPVVQPATIVVRAAGEREWE